jgi:hypothetical protein
MRLVDVNRRVVLDRISREALPSCETLSAVMATSAEDWEFYATGSPLSGVLDDACADDERQDPEPNRNANPVSADEQVNNGQCWAGDTGDRSCPASVFDGTFVASTQCTAEVRRGREGGDAQPSRALELLQARLMLVAEFLLRNEPAVRAECQTLAFWIYSLIAPGKDRRQEQAWFRTYSKDAVDSIVGLKAMWLAYAARKGLTGTFHPGNKGWHQEELKRMLSPLMSGVCHRLGCAEIHLLVAGGTRRMNNLAEKRIRQEREKAEDDGDDMWDLP